MNPTNTPLETLIQTRIRQDIQSMHAYAIQDSAGMVKLDAMENPYRLPEALRTELARALANAAINRYPDPTAPEVKTLLREVFRIPAGAGILIGNGSDEIIAIVTQALARPGAVVMAPEPSFVLNQPAYASACILVGDDEFGTGSSREQAPWGLADSGIRAVIAATFGDIYYFNAIQCGVLSVRLPLEACRDLRAQLHAQPGARMRIDLPAQNVTAPDGATHAFTIAPLHKQRLLEGLDDIGLTLKSEAQIGAFEAAYRQRFDWLFRECPS